jgi:hypothetical protein
MIDKLEMGDLLKPLEDRFKKFTGNQAQIYFDKLKWIEKDVIEKAIDILTDSAKAFPTPGEIKTACREAKEKHKLGRREKGCICCHHGVVFYRRNGKQFTGSCGHCCSGEVSIIPFYVQKNDTIFYARYTIRNSSGKLYVADTSRLEEDPECEPVHTNAWLKEYNTGPSMYDMQAIEAMRKTTEHFKVQSMAEVMQDARELGI